MNGCRPVYTQGWNEERKLLMKMVEIYKQVQYIQKRGKNKFHNYNYATEADVNEAVREEMAKLNIIMMPGIVHKELRTTTTKNGNTEYIYRVDMEFNFMDAETGESLVVPMSGEGQDVGDKAIFKAISGCQKYALMKAFMIPTGDDPEADEGVDARNAGKDLQKTQEPKKDESYSKPAESPVTSTTNTGDVLISAAQKGMVRALIKEKSIPEETFKEWVKSYGIESSNDLKKSQASAIIKKCQEYVAPAYDPNSDLPF